MQPNDTFDYAGKQLYYNTVPFNNRAERVVEIPVAFDFLSGPSTNGNVLELGHVLWHYENGVSDKLGLRSRRIIDKFEKAHRVENIDFLDITEDSAKYDTIVSISTVEHIGQGVTGDGDYGETSSRDYDGPLKALAKIYDLLADGGKALVTVPWGKLLDVGWLIQFDSEYFRRLVDVYGVPESAVQLRWLKRIFVDSNYPWKYQVWEEAAESGMRDIEFHVPWPFANGVACIYLTKESERTLPDHTPTISSERFSSSALIGGLYHQEALYGHTFSLAECDTENRIFTVPTSKNVFLSSWIDVIPGEYTLEIDLDLGSDADNLLELSIKAIDLHGKIMRCEIVKSGSYTYNFRIPGSRPKSIAIRMRNRSAAVAQVKVDRFTLRPQDMGIQDALYTGKSLLLGRIAQKILG